MKIFVVVSFTGEYDNWTQGIVKVFSTKEKAESFSVHMTNEATEAGIAVHQYNAFSKEFYNAIVNRDRNKFPDVGSGGIFYSVLGPFDTEV